MLKCTALILVAAAAASSTFHPGRGPELITLEEAGVSGTPGAGTARATGALLARFKEGGPLPSLPGVRGWEPLDGAGRVHRLLVEDGVDEVALSRGLKARGDVEWCHPDLEVSLVLHQPLDDPYLADQWHLENTGQQSWIPGVDVDAPTAWAISGGEGQLIAIIDSGVDIDHPDLRAISGWDYVDGDDDSSPDTSWSGGPHGTAAAGLAAAIGDNGIGVAGVAHGASVYGIRLLGGPTSLGDIYSAFVEAVDAGASVLSNSWGFEGSCDLFPIYASIQDAYDYAEEVGRSGLGAAVVVAAGNGACDMSEDGFQVHPAAISVAALSGFDLRESYSSYGDLVDIAAPSGGVLTTDISGDEGYGSWRSDLDYYGYFSGTSAAAPIVSGVLALMFSANPRLTAEDAREILCDTATRVDLEGGDYDEAGWSRFYGCGRVDAGAAVLAVANTAPEPPLHRAPGHVAWSHQVRLTWEPSADADGDPLTYQARWWLDGDDPGDWTDVERSGLDITGAVDAGDLVSWQLRALDLWGPGEPSAPGLFRVLDHPATRGPPECGALPRGSTTPWPLLALACLWPRARRRPARRDPTPP